jgi:hypothetical protein
MIPRYFKGKKRQDIKVTRILVWIWEAIHVEVMSVMPSFVRLIHLLISTKFRAGKGLGGVYEAQMDLITFSRNRTPYRECARYIRIHLNEVCNLYFKHISVSP